jgi:hypothetical protein
MTHPDLKSTGSTSLLDLFLGESFRFCFHHGHLVHSHLTIVSVAAVKSISVHVKVHVDSVRLVCNNGALAVTLS